MAPRWHFSLHRSQKGSGTPRAGHLASTVRSFSWPLIIETMQGGCGEWRGKEREKGLILFEELAHTVMGADKSRDLQLASWRPRRADGVSSTLNVGRLETQERPVFQFSLEGRKKKKKP